MPMTVSNDSTPRLTEKAAWGKRPHAGLILCLALLLRFLIVWIVIVRFPRNWLFTRGIELGTLAQSLLTGQGLSSPVGGDTGPTALLAPGYPVVIALVFRIFGSFTVAAAIAVMAMQVVFSVITVWLMMWVAGRYFGIRAANLSGAFWAVSLPLIWMPTIFWETCLSTLLLLGMMALVLYWDATPQGLHWALLGVYCGLAALVNPALLPALLAMLAWAAWPPRRALCLLVGLVTFALVFAPWPLRNARALHAFIPLRSTVGFELWVGNRAGATGFLDESQFPLFNRAEHAQYVRKGEVVYMHDKAALARAYIRAHPGEFVRRSAIRLLRFWMGTGTYQGSPIFPLHAVLTTALGLAGLWRLVQERRLRLALLFALPLLVFPLPYYITHAEFRYRLVIDPAVTMLGGYAFRGRHEWEAG